jgi:hypothetical protein
MQLGNTVNPHAEGPRPPERSVEYTSSTYLLVGAKPSVRQTVDRIIARSFVEKGQNSTSGERPGENLCQRARFERRTYPADLPHSCATMRASLLFDTAGVSAA